MSLMRRRAGGRHRWGQPDRGDAGEPVCRWCRLPVRPPRRTFCSEPCVHEWRLRSDATYVRAEVWKRDRGVCQRCAIDVGKAERRWRRARPLRGQRAASRLWRDARPCWEADHIVPVADGGGECGLDNYRVLCRACHVAVTTEWRARRRALEGLERALDQARVFLPALKGRPTGSASHR